MMEPAFFLSKVILFWKKAIAILKLIVIIM